MSRASPWEVLWSPQNPRKFIKYSNSDSSCEISLYNLLSEQDEIPSGTSRNQVIKLADDTYAKSVAVHSDFSSIKSVAWCPRKDLIDCCVLGVGMSNGHVSLINIGPDSPPNANLLLNLELVPKADRTCNELAWGSQEQDKNLLAVGLDKVRSETSLLVWDVEGSAIPANSPSAYSQRIPSSGLRRPLYEHGQSESTVSVAWLVNKPMTLVAGQGPKWLRTFDIRAPPPRGRISVVATTKAIYGIAVDPFFPDHIASFAEGPQGAVLVWDIRNSEKPIVTINQSKPVSKIHWCPTRTHMISVLQKDGVAVKSYDLQHTSFGPTMPYSGNLDEDNESIIFERNFQSSRASTQTLSSYSWHPSLENAMLTISSNGSMNYMKIFERITMSWSPSLDLVWGCGKHMLICSKDNISTPEIEDISFTMRQRALDGYGEKALIKDEKRMKEILKDKQLIRLWQWLRRVRRPKDQDTRKGRSFFGVKAIIKGEMSATVMNQKIKAAEKPKGRSNQSRIQEGAPISTKAYYSEDRRVALQLCDWDLNDQVLGDRLSKLCNDGEIERAAAMALFNKKINWAIDILSGASTFLKPRANAAPQDQRSLPADPIFPVVAMALSGYSEEKKTYWSDMCRSISTQLKRPYLRAMFAFLTTEDEDFSLVLRETEMELQDRIAFACKYLTDIKLITYVENVTTSLISGGNLEGLLLTGLTVDGIDLLENYITITSDVQTAILIILNAKVSEVFKDKRVSDWIEYYRDLLDQWRLWHERAMFDSLVQASDSSKKIPQQISVSCTYCSKAVSSNFLSTGGVMRMASGRFPMVGTSGRPVKAMACPGCCQPLPRCSICLLNMGSLSSHMQKSGAKVKMDNVVNNFNNWFTWCQNCRHGGHASHLTEWFMEHVECPVTGCNCCCNGQDSVAMVTPKETDVAVVHSEEPVT